ncbi:hypothetical protein ACQ7DA_07585 [Zafaria sp. J156]|uniref:hypothetical protein n=1 Tax=Zafaria sp. J156 TaxID=3116490 RepID=UPI002E76135E|nr:hypothetical protein [Zafaria sp. J156]MEE1620765.1 hypothetical protein [Zafaria sp. J156]
MYGQRRVGRVFSGAMTEVYKQRAARPAWQKRLTRLWFLAVGLGVGARINHHLGGPDWATGVLLAAAISLAVVLLVRRITAGLRARSGGRTER